MRIIGRLALITIFLAVAPSAEAGFHWLGDWEFTQFGDGSGGFSSSTWPDATFADLSASASYPGADPPPDESSYLYSEVVVSRSFEITHAPAGLPAVFSVGWFASVDYAPRTHGFAEATAGLSEVVDYSFVATPQPYGPQQEFYDDVYLEARLSEGTYSIWARARAGFSLGPGANFSGDSRSGLSISFRVAPEPTGSLLVVLGGALVGTARLATRRGRSRARRSSET